MIISEDEQAVSASAVTDVLCCLAAIADGVFEHKQEQTTASH